jgi:hypothetical protein
MAGVCVNQGEIIATQLLETGCEVLELGAPVGLPGGAFVVNGGTALIDGAAGLGRVDLSTFDAVVPAGFSLGWAMSDLSGTAWRFVCSGSLCGQNVDATDMIEIDSGGSTTGVERPLERPIDDLGRALVFAGTGRTAVITDSAFLILDHGTGQVDELPRPKFDAIGVVVNPPCDHDYGTVGVLEHSGGDDFLVFIDYDRVVRLRVRDSELTTVVSSYLYDGCMLGYDVPGNAWLVVARGDTDLVPTAADVPQLIRCPATFVCDGCL